MDHPVLTLFVPHSIFQLRLSTTRFRARRAYAHGPQPPFVIIYLLVGGRELLFSRCLLRDLLFFSLIVTYLPSFLLLSLRYGVGPYRHLQVIDAPITFFVSFPAYVTFRKSLRVYSIQSNRSYLARTPKIRALSPAILILIGFRARRLEAFV